MSETKMRMALTCPQCGERLVIEGEMQAFDQGDGRFDVRVKADAESERRLHEHHAERHSAGPRANCEPWCDQYARCNCGNAPEEYRA